MTFLILILIKVLKSYNVRVTRVKKLTLKMKSTSSSFTELLDYFINVDIESLSPAAVTSAQKAEIVSAFENIKPLLRRIRYENSRREINTITLTHGLRYLNYQIIDIDTPFDSISDCINNISRSCLEILDNLPPCKNKFSL